MKLKILWGVIREGYPQTDQACNREGFCDSLTIKLFSDFPKLEKL
jgi:hypothetical protein